MVLLPSPKFDDHGEDRASWRLLDRVKYRRERSRREFFLQNTDASSPVRIYYRPKVPFWKLSGNQVTRPVAVVDPVQVSVDRRDLDASFR